MQEGGQRERQESLLARDEGERREGAEADHGKGTDGRRGAGTAERTAAVTLEGRGLRAESRRAGATSLPRRPRAQSPQSVHTWGACSTPTWPAPRRQVPPRKDPAGAGLAHGRSPAAKS